MKDAIIQLAKAQNVKTVGGGGNTLQADVTTILTAVIAVLGLACVVVMIIGGTQYMTSVGDTQKVEKGKKTILYGAIGLAICALSFAIVNFVIKDIIQGGANSSETCKNGLVWDSEEEECVKK